MTDEDRKTIEEIVNTAVQSTNDRLDAAVQSMNGRLESMNGHLESMNGRLESMNGRLESMNGRLDAVNDRLDAAVQSTNDRLDAVNARLDAAVQSVTAATTANLADLRTEFLSRFSDIDRRLDRLTEITISIQANIATLNRWADRLDKDQAALGQNYHAQQRAIEDLRRRVEALEKKAS